MPRTPDNRIYIFHDVKDYEKALNLKHRMIESYYNKVLDIKILNKEDDMLMTNAYEIKHFPTLVIMDKSNVVLSKYESLNNSFDELIIKAIKKEIEKL